MMVYWLDYRHFRTALEIQKHEKYTLDKEYRRFILNSLKFSNSTSILITMISKNILVL